MMCDDFLAPTGPRVAWTSDSPAARLPISLLQSMPPPRASADGACECDATDQGCDSVRLDSRAAHTIVGGLATMGAPVDQRPGNEPVGSR